MMYNAHLLPEDLQMTDTYPIGYKQARRRFSSDFINVFDQLVTKYGPKNISLSAVLPSSESPFFIFALPFYLIGTPFMPILAVINCCYNCGAASIRADLYDSLVGISQSSDSDARISVIQQQPCLNALRDETLNMGDLSRCPLNLLQHLIRPEIISILKENEIQPA